MLLTGQSEIVSGPCREELFDAMRLCAEYRTTDFSLRDKVSYTVKAGVVGIEPIYEGSGHDWRVKLYIMVNGSPQVVEGVYSTSTRKGTLALDQQTKEIDIDALKTELSELQRIMQVALPGLMNHNLGFKESIKRLKIIISA